ncbi:MAG: hypothetical protein ACR2QH_01035 [Geminicoccaceae bacterium]
MAIRIATMIRIGGLVFSAALFAFGSVASAGNLKSFNQQVADAYAPYRSAMFYLRTGNPGVALLELEAASKRWQAVVDQFGKAVPDAFVGDPDFAASLKAIGGSLDAGLKSIEDDDQKTATDVLTTIRADLSDLRHRNSIRTFSDCIDDMNAAMDRLWAFRHEPPAFDEVDQVNAVKREAAITEFLYRRCYETAPSAFRDDESFNRMFEGSLISLPLIYNALDEGNEGMLINILRELRSFDRMIWLHFG